MRRLTVIKTVLPGKPAIFVAVAKGAVLPNVRAPLRLVAPMILTDPDLGGGEELNLPHVALGAVVRCAFGAGSRLGELGPPGLRSNVAPHQTRTFER